MSEQDAMDREELPELGPDALDMDADADLYEGEDTGEDGTEGVDDDEGFDPDALKEIAGAEDVGDAASVSGQVQANEQMALSQQALPVTVDLDEAVPEVSFIPVDDGAVLPQYEDALKALDDRVEEGEIGIGEYNRQRDAIMARMRQEKFSAQRWDAEQQTFYRHNPDWHPGKNRILWGALNQEVLRIANSPEGAGMTGIQVIYAARKAVAQALHLPAKTQRQEAAAVTEQQKPRPAAQRPNVKTLGGLPAAEANDTGGEFGYLERMNGPQLRAELQRLERSEPLKYQRYVDAY